MSDKELRGLDAWIAKHLFGRADVEFSEGNISWDADNRIPKNYTTNPAASDELDERIIDKLGGRPLLSWNDGKSHYFESCVECETILAAHKDKKICRAIFAKKLFTK